MSRRKNSGSFILPVLLLFCVLNAMLASSCSRETRHKTLTFFFTGVPPLDNSGAPAQAVQGKREAGQPVLAEEIPKQELLPFKKHPPFAEGKCGACHNTANGNKLFTEPEKLCFRCHKNFADEYHWVHGPAAVGSCNQCHEPHQSRNEHLLISNTQDICFKCHRKTDILSQTYHQFGKETLCIDCHSPHGGSDRRLLKAQTAGTGSLGERGSDNESPAS